MEDSSLKRTRTSTIRLGDDGIVRVVMSEATIETLDEAQENIAAISEVAHGRLVPVLVDFRLVRSQDRQAREYYAGAETAKVITSVALLTGSPLSRVVANFFLGLNKPLYPTRLFTKESEALEWLKGYVG